MKRRFRPGGEPIKQRRRKAAKPIRRNASEAVARSNSSFTSEETEVARLTRELSETREQHAATADVLKVISRSAFNLRIVLDTLVQSAARLCEADTASLVRPLGSVFQQLASYGYSQELNKFMETHPVYLGRGTVTGRTVVEGKTVQIPDVLADAEFTFTESVKIGGMRTMLGVPLLRDGVPIGVIMLSRRTVRPFSDKQVELVKTFADQAVIAIENTRVLNELRQRTTDLTEALEQQTATSEVLQTISKSPGELQPVFHTMLANAVQICDAKFGNLLLFEDGAFRTVALHGAPQSYLEERQREPVIQPKPGSDLDQLVKTKQAVHVPDIRERGMASGSAIVELAGARTILTVPMVKEGDLVGAIGIYRQEVRPFADKQIELVRNFAAQAIIAIENARLLNELRARTTELTERTTDLTEALEQQTATSEVLQVVSSSPSDLQPVFATMLEKAVRICEATFGDVYRSQGDTIQLVAMQNTPVAFAEALKQTPHFRPSSSVGLRMVATKSAVQVTDLAADPDYVERRSPFIIAAVKLGGVRTVLAVPMLKESELIGAFMLCRQEVRPFTDKQIELVKNFAAQAVIAIENARLLNELRQSLEQQTATAKVLEVISRSAFDLRAVFETVAESSVRLCGADRAFIFQFDGALLKMAASYNATPEFPDWVRQNPIRPGRHSGSARAALERKTVHIPDVRADPEYVYGAKDVEAIRTILGVPILKGDELLGVMMIYHLEVRPFTDNQIALVETFADQAAIAIENVRLFEAEQQRARENARLLNELRERTAEIEKLNQHLEQRVTDQVDEIERMSRLRRFLPPQVADLIVASGGEKQLESHRREITALFCDLRGFTGFSESADPEDVMTLLREYHEAIGASIIKYSGTLERYAGDGVMVVFNDPVPVENPALQSVLMALEMRDAIGALTETWRRWGHDIGFGIGIAHGFATLGTIGFEGRFDYAAIGTVSNVASRLCDEAKPGQILISPRVLTKVENAVQVEPVGEFELKGIRRPLAAYNVLGAVSVGT